MNNETLVNSIRELCRIHNITVTKLEETLGMSQGLISRWVKSDPSLSKIIDIANYFRVSIDELLGNIKYEYIDDEFLMLLIRETSNGKISWKPFDKNTDANIHEPHYGNEEEDIFFDENIFTEHKYYTSIENGYVSIVGLCEYNKSLFPDEIILCIQPTATSKGIEQIYSTKELTSLWTVILKNAGDKAPDDVLAEAFKQSFVRDVRRANNEIKVSITRCPID